MFFGALVSLMILLTAGFSYKENDYEKSQTVVALRNVAHQTLLISGDSTSPVPPVAVMEPDKYEISFNTIVSIHPDSLVNSFISSFDDYTDKQRYVVEVKRCYSDEIVYAYEMFGTKEESIIPCTNRSLSRNCYKIHVSFRESGFSLGKSTMAIIASSLMFFAFISGSYFSGKSGVSPLQESAEVKENGVRLGLYRFIPEELQLIYEDQEITLTSKESELLHLFAKNLNQIVSREKLEKEIWEDKGVVVGRSLDVFISKLRKKLRNDADIQIVNVHGVGYKLAIAAS